MIAAVLSLLLAGAAVTAPLPSSGSSDILVIGHQVSDFKAALQACLAQQCPPNEDIDASLALAESQLLDGKYHDARTTLLGALSRNKKEADAYPVPVSDLYRANGKVAASLGFDRDYYLSTWGMYRTLKRGLPAEKDRQYSALMEVAEMMYRTRGHEAARNYYRQVIDGARRDGRPDIAALAELRMTIRHLPPYMREGEIRRILASTDATLRAPILEGKLALARMAYAENDLVKGDGIVRELARLDIKQPILIYAPEYTLHVQDDQATSFAKQDPPVAEANIGHGRIENVRTTPNSGIGGAMGVGQNSVGMSRLPILTEDTWLDVTFWVTPDGKVADLAVARSRGDTGWAAPLLNSIRGRRYTPVAEGSPAALRRERYTFTSGVETGASSHLTLHSPNPRVEYMDLSDIAAAN
jgi:hypothetical protein